MTQLRLVGQIPTFELHDRLSKALEVAGIGVAEMAEQLGVSRETVGRWINARGTSGPKRATLVAWASITGVDLVWLETGQAPAVGPTPGEPVRHQGLEPRTRWFREFGADLQLVGRDAAA